VEKLDHEPEAERCDDKNEDALQNSEDKLKISGFFDAEIVQSCHEPGDGDGEDLGPKQWQAGDVVTEKVKCRKHAEGTREAAGDGGDGGRLGNGEPGPHVEKGGRVAVGSAQVDILAAGVRHHGAEFGIGHGAEEREQATDDPGEIDKRRRADILHHLARNEKNAAADNGADYNGGRLAGAEHARQIGGSGGSRSSGSRDHAVM
jgi:hypothetical protein